MPLLSPGAEEPSPVMTAGVAGVLVVDAAGTAAAVEGQVGERVRGGMGWEMQSSSRVP